MTLEKWIRALDKVLEYSLYGIAFFIPISIALVETCTVLAIVAFVLKKAIALATNTNNERSFHFLLRPPTLWLLLFFIFCLLSVFNSPPYLGKSLNALLGKWGKFIMLYFSVSDHLREEGRIRSILNVFLASAALVVLDTFSQRFLGIEFLLGRPMVDVNYAGRTVYAVTGALKHPNDFAVYLTCMVPMLYSFRLGLHHSKPPQTFPVLLHRSTLSLALCLLIIALVLTYSRAGWLGLLIACGVMLLCLPEKKWLIGMIAGFIALVAFSPGMAERVSMTLRSGGDSGRYQLWNGTWAMIADHPLSGRGIGTFMAVFQDYVQGRGAMYAHNCYLQIWAETGFFALLFFLLFLAWVFKEAFSSLHKTPTGETRYLLAGLSGGALAFLVQSAFDTNLYSLQPSALFWLVLGMISALSKKDPRERLTP